MSNSPPQTLRDNVHRDSDNSECEGQHLVKHRPRAQVLLQASLAYISLVELSIKLTGSSAETSPRSRRTENCL